MRYLVEGSIQRAGGRVRVNAQLIDAATGGHLWAERYDGDETDLFTLQDRVIANIVSALAVKLTDTEKDAAVAPADRQPRGLRLLSAGRAEPVVRHSAAMRHHDTIANSTRSPSHARSGVRRGLRRAVRNGFPRCGAGTSPRCCRIPPPRSSPTSPRARCS